MSNASPVILLAKVDEIDLLSRLADTLIIPAAVAEEIHAGAASDPARHWIQGPGQEFVHVLETIPPEVAAWDLGRGEAAVLSWARSREAWTALLDDGAARRAARAFDISVSGTLGVVLTAKEEGEIKQVRPMMEALVQAGLRASELLLEQTLRLAGEA